MSASMSALDDKISYLPPPSCPRLSDRSRELRCIICFFLLLTIAIGSVILLSTWVNEEYEMTSVTSTRDLRPIPKLLSQVQRDPSSLPTIYYGQKLTPAHGNIVEGLPPPPPSTSSSCHSCMLLVLVDSAADNIKMRRSIRATWKTHPSVGVSACVVFSIVGEGLSPTLREELEEESQRFNDLVVFPESKALPESEHLLYQLFWAEATFDYTYLLKTKDQFYVRLETLLHDLRRLDLNSNVYWGYFDGTRRVGHSWSGKHSEPDWFLCSTFIRFAHSGGYIVSRQLIQRLLKTADYLQLYQNEDISIATWLTPFNDVEWRHDARFDTDVGMSRGCLNSYIIFPVNSPSDMVQRHDRLEQSGHVCRKEHTVLQSHTYDFTVKPAECCRDIV